MMTKTTQRGAEPANVFEDRATPGQWRVEWFGDDGRCELEIFTATMRDGKPCATLCKSTGISEKCS